MSGPCRGWQNSGLNTDLYQLTMLAAYFERGMNETAVFEFFMRRLPDERNFLVAAGLEQALEYLESLEFTAPELEQMHRVKAAFDPAGLMNPGKAVPTLSRCAEVGGMHVHRGRLPFPNLPRF